MNHGNLAVGLLAVLALAGVSTAHALKGDADQPINVRAKSVDVNEKTGVATYVGAVVMTQGSLRLEGDRVEVTRRANRLELAKAFGRPAKMTTRTDAGEELEGRALRIEYHATERVIDLYGKVSLKRDQDWMTGATAHYDIDTQRLTARGDGKGQVNAVIQPAKPEPAP